MSPVLAPLAPHLRAAVAAFVHEHGVASVAAGAVVRGEPVWTFGYGTIDVDGGRVPGAATAYRVGSLTKPFTAAAVLRLCDRGAALELDDPVIRHVPELDALPDGASVRLHHLLMHRSGLPSEIPSLDEAAGVYPTIEQTLAELAEVRLLHPPGTAMRYSNLGYQILGELVARVAGTTYEQVCARELFEPLGLVGTGFDRPSGAARGHHARAFTDRLRPAPDRPKRTLADGGLWSTVADQAAWIEAQLGGPETPLGRSLRRMHGPERGTDLDGGAGQGLGWFRERLGARTVVYHQGSTPGFSARLAFAPELGAGVVALANAGGIAMAGLTAALVDLVLDGVEGAFPREPAPTVLPPPEAAPYPASWDELLGFYVWPGSALLFRLEERAGSLRLVDLGTDEPPISLAADADDRFVALDGGWAGERIHVVRRAEGGVRGLRVGSWFVARLVEVGETFGPGA